MLWTRDQSPQSQTNSSNAVRSASRSAAPISSPAALLVIGAVGLGIAGVNSRVDIVQAGIKLLRLINERIDGLPPSQPGGAPSDQSQFAGALPPPEPVELPPANPALDLTPKRPSWTLRSAQSLPQLSQRAPGSGGTAYSPASVRPALPADSTALQAAVAGPVTNSATDNAVISAEVQSASPFPTATSLALTRSGEAGNAAIAPDRARSWNALSVSASLLAPRGRENRQFMAVTASAPRDAPQDRRPIVTRTQATDSATFTWAGTAGSDWGNAANWGGAVPGSGDTASFVNTGTTTPTLVSAAQSVAGLSFASNAQAFTIGGSNALTIGAGGITNGAGTTQTISTGSLIVGAAQTWNVGTGGVTIVAPLSGNGAVTVAGTVATTSNVTDKLTLSSNNSSFTGGLSVDGLGGPAPGFSAQYAPTTALNLTAAQSGGAGTLSINGGNGTDATGGSFGRAGAPGGAALVTVSNVGALSGVTAINLTGGTTGSSAEVINQNRNNPPTTVPGGAGGAATLSLNVAGGTVTTGADLRLGGTATVALNGANLSVGGLDSGGGTVVDNGGSGNSTLTVGSDNGNHTFSGILEDNAGSGTGTLALVKNGAGTLTLTGAGTFTGGTTVSAGTLIVGDTPTDSVDLIIDGINSTNGVSRGAVSVLDGGTLAVGEAANRAAGGIATGTLTLSSLKGGLGSATPLLTFNLGVSGTSDLLNLTGSAPLTVSGSGAFTIGFASATGAGIPNGATYSLMNFASPMSSAALPSVSVFQSAGIGNLTTAPGAFEYVRNSSGAVLGLDFLAIGGVPPAPASGPSATWSGGGADNLFTTNANWSGAAPSPTGNDSLILTGSTRLSPQINTAFTANSLTFASGAGAFNAGGTGSLTLNNGGIMQSSANLQTISTSGGVIVAQPQTWCIGSSGLTVSSAIASSTGAGNVPLTIASSGALTLSGNNRGLTGGLTMNADSGTLGGTTPTASTLNLSDAYAGGSGTLIGAAGNGASNAFPNEQLSGASGGDLTVNVNAADALDGVTQLRLTAGSGGTGTVGDDGANGNGGAVSLNLSVADTLNAGSSFSLSAGNGGIKLMTYFGGNGGGAGAFTMNVTAANAMSGLATLNAFGGNGGGNSDVGDGGDGGSFTINSSVANGLNGIGTLNMAAGTAGSNWPFGVGGAGGAVTLNASVDGALNGVGTLNLTGGTGIGGAAQLNVQSAGALAGVGAINLTGGKQGFTEYVSGVDTAGGNAMLVLNPAMAGATVTTNADITLAYGTGGIPPRGLNYGINQGGGAIVTLNGDNLTIGGLDSAGTANLNSLVVQNEGSSNSTLTVGDSNNHTFGGILEDNDGAATATGTLALVKTGSGTLTLSGANTYSGGTTVSGGLLAAAGTALGTGTVTVNNGATLAVGESPNATSLAQPTATLTIGALTVAGGGGTPALTFNLGDNGTSDKLALSSLSVTGGSFEIGFAGATGQPISDPTYTLLSFTNPTAGDVTGLDTSTANAANGDFLALAVGNLVGMQDGTFAWTYDGSGNVSGLTYTISDAATANSSAVAPEPPSYILLLLAGALPMGIRFRTRRLHSEK